MAAWTGFVLRFRVLVLVFWALVALSGFVAYQHLAPLLSNQFTVPGTDSERARTLLQRHFGDRPDGSFQLVFQVRDSRDPALLRRLGAVAARAAAGVRTARATPAIPASRHVVYANVLTSLDFSTAKRYTPRLLAAVARTPGVEHVYVTGAPAIQHDLDPIFQRDLFKGEAIALPIAFLVLVAVLGISWAIAIPFAFALATIFGSLGILYGVAQLATTPTYATNLVQLIGLGIAIDYSLLIVYRFREELASGRDVDDAVVRTMETAGRSVVFSGATVAIGLALLIALPLPFMRMLGIAGFLIPLVSVLAALTLQPAMLSVFGRRGVARRRILPTEPIDPEHGFWARLARSIMRRPVVYLAAGAAVLVAAAMPALWLALTPGSSFGIPRFPQSVRGFDVLRAATGPGAVGPTQVVVDSGRGGGVRSPVVTAALGRLLVSLRPGRRGGACVLAAGRAVRRLERPLRPGDRADAPRLRPARGAAFRAAAPLDAHPGRTLPARCARLRRRRPAAGRRLPRPGVPLLPVPRRRGARPHVPAAPPRVPLACSCR